MLPTNPKPPPFVICPASQPATAPITKKMTIPSRVIRLRPPDIGLLTVRYRHTTMTTLQLRVIVGERHVGERRRLPCHLTIGRQEQRRASRPGFETPILAPLRPGLSGWRAEAEPGMTVFRLTPKKMHGPSGAARSKRYHPRAAGGWSTCPARRKATTTPSPRECVKEIEEAPAYRIGRVWRVLRDAPPFETPPAAAPQDRWRSSAGQGRRSRRTGRKHEL